MHDLGCPPCYFRSTQRRRQSFTSSPALASTLLQVGLAQLYLNARWLCLACSRWSAWSSVQAPKQMLFMAQTGLFVPRRATIMSACSRAATAATVPGTLVEGSAWQDEAGSTRCHAVFVCRGTLRQVTSTALRPFWYCWLQGMHCPEQRCLILGSFTCRHCYIRVLQACCCARMWPRGAWTSQMCTGLCSSTRRRPVACMRLLFCQCIAQSARCAVWALCLTKTPGLRLHSAGPQCFCAQSRAHSTHGAQRQCR